MDENRYHGEPWEKQSWETDKGYAAFNIYLQMSPHSRSLQRLADDLGYANARWVKEWSRKYSWQERVAAYDAHVARQSREAREKEHEKQLRQYAEEQRKLYESTMELSQDLLDRCRELMEEAGDEDFSASDIPRLLRTAAAIAETASTAQAQILGVHDILEFFDEA